MKKLIFAFALVALTGCSTLDRSFTDHPDNGQTWTTHLTLAPFSTLGEDVAEMEYVYDFNGEAQKGRISVGGRTTGLDNSGQIEALIASFAGASALLSAYLASQGIGR